jgi:hypothetical protein
VLSFPADSKHVAILSIVFKTEPLSLFVEFFILTDLPVEVYFEALLAEELAGLFAERIGLDGVVTGAAMRVVTTVPGGLTTSPPEALIGGRGGMVSVGGTSASNMP